MIGFTYENYTITEGEDMLTNITVDLHLYSYSESVVVWSAQCKLWNLNLSCDTGKGWNLETWDHSGVGYSLLSLL